MRRQLIIVSALLAGGALIAGGLPSSRNDLDAVVSTAVAVAPETAASELSTRFLREGWRLERAGRLKEAQRAAMLAAFLGDRIGAEALAAVVEDRRRQTARSLKREAFDAERAGDDRRAERARALGLRVPGSEGRR